ncbi:hypothetical protein ACFL4W_01640 [Planctomycetota bacterium]
MKSFEMPGPELKGLAIAQADGEAPPAEAAAAAEPAAEEAAADGDIVDPPAAGAQPGDDGIWKPPAAGAGTDDEVWKPPAGDEVPAFVDKGEKDTALDEKKQFEFNAEYRNTSFVNEPAAPELSPLSSQLFYFEYYMGLTSTTSLQVEGQKFTYEDESDSSWLRADWAALLPSEARVDLELAGLWEGDGNNGLRAAGAYGWPAGLNLDLSVRLQVSEVEDVWGYQGEVEGQAYLSPTTSMWGKTFYYWDDNDSQKSQIGVGLGQYLGLRTGLHLEANFGDAESEDELSELIEGSSASFRIEIRHRLLGSDTLLRCAYFNYFDSWHTGAESYSLRVEQPVEGGSVGVGFRIFRTDEGLEAGTWMLSSSYKW